MERPTQLVWRRADEDDVERWTDHTVASDLEELIVQCGKALDAVRSALENERENHLGASDVTIKFGTTNVRKLNLHLNQFALVDFSSNDSRATFVSRWFGIKGPYLSLAEGNTLMSRSNAQRLLSALRIALVNKGMIELPIVVPCCGSVVHSTGFLGYISAENRIVESDVTAPKSGQNTKLEDFLRIFKALQSSSKSGTSRTEIIRVTARLTWQLHIILENSLLAGIRASAVFPVSPEGGFFENELFSTLTADKCRSWTVLAVWKCARSSPLETSGGGSYDQDANYSLMPVAARSLSPLSSGLRNLARSAELSDASDRQEVGMSASSAEKLVEKSFQHGHAPFSSFLIGLLRLLGETSTSHDPNVRPAVEVAWKAFCHKLRWTFETREEVLDEDLVPDLARSSVHQKVALVRFCTRELNAKDGDLKESTGEITELDFSLVKDPSRRVRAPPPRRSLVWELREDDAHEHDLGNEVRAELSANSLVADMRAFRDVNGPLSDFQDFVRWFSPKDIENGVLSPRMVESRVWLGAWRESEKDEPRKVFDPEARAEKALHRLETISMNELCQYLVQDALIDLRGLLENRKDECFGKNHWASSFSILEHAQNALVFADAFEVLEGRMSRVDSLRVAEAVLGEGLVKSLVDDEGACSFKAGTVHAEAITNLIRAQRQGLGQPDKKEYILMDSNHRQYASVSSSEVLLARNFAAL